MGGTMLAARLHAPGDLRLEEVPIPEPEAGEVLVRVGACGICASDVPRVLQTGTYRFPLIPGHEFAGTVAALGSGVTDWQAGDRVAVYPLLPCRECHECRAGRYELCDNYDYLGSRRDGAFAEYVVAPAGNLVRVPDGVPLADAATTEPVAVALHALRRYGVQVPETVAVWGAGLIGTVVAQWARALGAKRVWLVDVIRERLHLARGVVEAELVDGSQTDAVEALRAQTEGRGPELVIEAAGAPPATRQALAAAAKAGCVVLLGNPSADVAVPRAEVSSILRRQLTIRGSWNSSFWPEEANEWREALEALAAGRIRVAPLITHRLPLTQAPDAFRMMAERREFFSKVMLVWD